MKYLENQVIVVLVVKKLEGLESKIQKLVDQGYKVIEVTLRTKCALEAIKIIKIKFPDLKVGAGTVLTIEQLKTCVKNKADFGVAPGLNKDVVLFAKEQGFDFVPGISTPSEIELAMSLGLDLVKIFPAKVLGGVAFIKAVSSPYHMMKFMPTGGVSESDHQTYLALPSVFCVGGTWMNK
jgi:2-dehydro-3-deoxyphosphogluconate aldolase/(4S)-4-hydroxy-2-oxoglutarate aldolase